MGALRDSTSIRPRGGTPFRTAVFRCRGPAGILVSFGQIACLSRIATCENDDDFVGRNPSIQHCMRGTAARYDQLTTTIFHRATYQRMMFENHDGFTESLDCGKRELRIARCNEFEDMFEMGERPCSVNRTVAMSLHAVAARVQPSLAIPDIETPRSRHRPAPSSPLRARIAPPRLQTDGAFLALRGLLDRLNHK